MPGWIFLGGLAAATSFLVGRGAYRRSQQQAAANASGLTAVADLTHLPASLQRTALWALGDGGFEQRVIHGTVSRAAHDIEITAFDLETLRERRGEWAWLPVDPPFRIAGMVSVVVCEIDRRFPHVLFKRTGRGDDMLDDGWVDRQLSIAKSARDRLGLDRAYAAELPAGLDATPLAVTLPEHWRAYGQDAELVGELTTAGFAATLAQASRRDLVIELLDGLVVVYPAARDVVGPDALADLATTALAVVDGVLASSRSLSPRGVETRRVTSPGPLRSDDAPVKS